MNLGYFLRWVGTMTSEKSGNPADHGKVIFLYVIIMFLVVIAVFIIKP